MVKLRSIARLDDAAAALMELAVERSGDLTTLESSSKQEAQAKFTRKSHDWKERDNTGRLPISRKHPLENSRPRKPERQSNFIFLYICANNSNDGIIPMAAFFWPDYNGGSSRICHSSYSLRERDLSTGVSRMGYPY